jgi:hypothetical protein
MTEAKFSGLQRLENSQNGERISIFRETVPHAAGTPAPIRQARCAVGRPSRHCEQREAIQARAKERAGSGAP